MGFIRGSLVVLISILLFVSLLSLNSFFTLSKSLEYENVQIEATPLVYELTNLSSSNILGIDSNISEKIQEGADLVEQYCANYSDYTFDYQGTKITLPCEEVKTITNSSSQSILNATVKNFIKNIYYRNYDCNFLDCFSKYDVPFFLISEKAKDYWGDKFYFSLLVSVVLAILLFIFVEYKSNFFLISGILLIATALPFLKLSSLLISFYGTFAYLFKIFLSQASSIFWIMFPIGLILIGVGILFKSVKFGTWIGEKIKQFRDKRMHGPRNISIKKV